MEDGVDAVAESATSGRSSGGGGVLDRSIVEGVPGVLGVRGVPCLSGPRIDAGGDGVRGDGGRKSSSSPSNATRAASVYSFGAQIGEALRIPKNRTG